MAQARLKSITVKAFRSFVAETTVNLPESGTVLFRGFNLDTGGSSGSGKSSLLLAITYLFGVCRYPATALQSWLTDEPMEVSGVIQVNDGELVITRGQKLSLTLNGKKIPGSAKQLEDKINSLLGLPPDLLSALTYRGQKQPGLFLSKTDAEKKEFLTVLLDLGRFETAVEVSQNKVKLIEAEARGDQLYVEKLRQEVAALGPVKPALLQSETKVRQDLGLAVSMLERIRTQVQDVRQKIRSHEARIDAEAARIRREAEPRLKELQGQIFAWENAGIDETKVDRSNLTRLEGDFIHAQSFLKEELEQDQARHRAQRNQADSLYAQLVLLEKQLAEKPVIEARLIEIKGELEKLTAHICPTCERQWDEAEDQRLTILRVMRTLADRHEAIQGLKPKIDSLQAEYRALGEFTANPVVEELRGITNGLGVQIATEKQKIEGEISAMRGTKQAMIAASKADLQKAQLDVSAAVEYYRANAKESLFDDQDQLEVLEREQAVAESAVRGIEAALNRVQIDNARETEREAAAAKQNAALTASLQKAEQDLKSKQDRLNAELDFQKLIGREGFLGAIFDEVLWEISEETNRVLGLFPNTAHVTLHFRSEASTQKGTIKKSITPVVTIGGFEAPLSSGLSGGMESAVEMAVDLAVASVVSRRTGAMPGWLILDESFTGLGPVEAEACMEILRAFGEDKLVLIVDHASEFKSLFSQFVDVKYQSGQSRVE